jgi:hypothetical protein
MLYGEMGEDGTIPRKWREEFGRKAYVCGMAEI